MKKFYKIVCAMLLCLTCIGTSFMFSGCTQKEKEELMETVQSTTNSLSNEYSADITKVILSDAIAKSVLTHNITMTGYRETYNNGVFQNKEELLTSEIVENNKSVIYMQSKSYNLASTIAETYTNWIVCISNKYYILDEENKTYTELSGSIDFMGVSKTFNALLTQLDNVYGAKYTNGELQIAIKTDISESTLININKDGRISNITTLSLSSSYTETSVLNFSYNDVEFSNPIPTSLNGYNLNS